MNVLSQDFLTENQLTTGEIEKRKATLTLPNGEQQEVEFWVRHIGVDGIAISTKSITENKDYRALKLASAIVNEDGSPIFTYDFIVEKMTEQLAEILWLAYIDVNFSQKKS